MLDNHHSQLSANPMKRKYGSMPQLVSISLEAWVDCAERASIAALVIVMMIISSAPVQASSSTFNDRIDVRADSVD